MLCDTPPLKMIPTDSTRLWFSVRFYSTCNLSSKCRGCMSTNCTTSLLSKDNYYYYFIFFFADSKQTTETQRLQHPIIIMNIVKNFFHIFFYSYNITGLSLYFKWSVYLLFIIISRVCSAWFFLFFSTLIICRVQKKKTFCSPSIELKK